MSKKIDFSSIGGVTDDQPAKLDFSHLGGVTEDEPKAKPSMTDSAIKGAQQGALMGFGDEAQGGIDAGLDATQSLLAKLGIMDPSPTDVNKKLADQGVKGNIGPKSTLEAYQNARDSARADYKEAQDTNPWSFGVGAVAGGVASIPLMPAKVVAPFGVAAEGANVGARMLQAARNAAPLSAAMAAGNSEASPVDDTQKFVSDLIYGTGAGMAGSAALTGGAAGVKAGYNLAKTGAGKLIPKLSKIAFNKKYDVSGPEFYDDVHDRVVQAVDEVGNPIIDKSKAQVQAYDDNINALKTQRDKAVADAEARLEQAKLNQKNSVEAGKHMEVQKNELAQQNYADDISDLDKQIAQLQEQQQKAVELGKQRQSAQNAEQIKAAQENGVKVATETQEHLGEVQKTLGKAFDQVEAAADKTGIVPDSREPIANFAETIKYQSGLPDNEVESIIKKLVPSMDGEGGVQDYKNLKLALSKYFEHANPVVRKAAKAAYSQVKSNYSNALSAGGYDELAARMAETNKKWSALANLQEDFIQNTKPDYVTGKIYPSNKTLDSITKFGEQNAKQMGGSDRMTDLMKIADPEGASSIIGKISGQADDVLAAKNATSAIPELPDPRIAQALEKQAAAKQGFNATKAFTPDVPELPNPEIARLQTILDQARAIKPTLGNVPNPSRVEGVPLSADPIELKKQLTRLLPKYGMQTGDDVSESTLNSIFDFLKKEKGEDFVNQLQGKLKPLAEDVALRNSQTGGPEFPTGLKGLALKAIGGTVKLSNNIGKAARSVEGTVEKASNLVNGPISDLAPQFMKNGVKSLASASPERIQNLAQRMAEVGGEEGQGFAKVLTEGLKKNNVSRNAIMFGLMQQPKFRELFHKLETQESSSDEPVK